MQKAGETPAVRKPGAAPASSARWIGIAKILCRASAAADCAPTKKLLYGVVIEEKSRSSVFMRASNLCRRKDGRRGRTVRAGRWFQILAAMLVSASPLFAQSDPCLQRSVTVSVVDNQGEMVPGLTAKNFQASIRREPIKILSVTQSNTPRVVIVLDASKTMLGEKSEWEFSIDSAKELSNALPRGAALGLIVFPSKVEETISLTGDPQAIAAELDDVKSSRREISKGLRKTTLWDAMRQALSLLGAPEAGDTLYVISDGLDKASRTQMRNFERSTGTVRIFALVPDPYPNAAPASGTSQELLHLAADSGGSPLIVSTEHSVERDDPVFSPVKPPPYFDRVLTGSQIGVAKEAQFRRIGSFYGMEIQLPDRLEKTSNWSVKAEVLSEASDRGLKVIYPRQLGPCEVAKSSAKTAR
jgi:hypothetical protein